MVRLASTRYQGANHTHLSELLAERECIHIGRTTLRRILLDAGLSSPRRRRPPKHRVRRQRMPRAGMLIQLDGSYHRWLGDHSPPFTLLLAVDDATGSVVNTLFCRQEDSRNYFLLMQNLLRRCGIHLALYTDRHAVFKHTPGSGSTGTPTQFGRAMAELGIQMIFALSPQAKGRVGRAVGTFQDRLITELRLAGATTIEQAKAVLKQFLPRYNRRFQVPAQCPDPAFRPLPPDLRLGQVLCFKHKRRVARDNTVKFQRHTLQLLPDRHRRSYAGATVVVLQGLDGRLSLQHEGRIIAAQEAPPSPGSLRNGIKPSSGDASQSPDPKGLSEPRETAPEPLTMVAAANGHGSVIDDEDVVSMTVTTSPRSDRRQLVLPVATTIFAGRDGVIIRYGGTVDYRPTNQAIEAETYGRQDTGNGSGQGWDERAFSAQVAAWAIAVAGETGASVAHPSRPLRRGVGG